MAKKPRTGQGTPSQSSPVRAIWGNSCIWLGALCVLDRIYKQEHKKHGSQ
jgi:hypothetical protein